MWEKCLESAGIPSVQVLAATGEAAELAEREIRVMQQMQHPNIMPLLAYSRAMAPMDADQGVTTYYMLFPLFKVTTQALPDVSSG